MEPKFEVVTPAKAQDWLNKHNNSNRSLREGVAEQYAGDMRAGRWTQCTAPIGFYEDGDLADGQHRLFAVVEADTPQRFIILRGLKREDGLNIDTGLARRLTDNGRISGLDVNLTPGVVAAARAVEFGMPSISRMSFADRAELVAKHREACDFAVQKMPRTKNVCNSATIGAVARAWYWEQDKDRLDQFCKVMGNGFYNGDGDSAAVAMRNYMLQHPNEAATTLWRDSFLKTQNAIHYFMKRQRLTVIKSVKEEAYPLRKKITRKGA